MLLKAQDQPEKLFFWLNRKTSHTIAKVMAIEAISCNTRMCHGKGKGGVRRVGEAN